MIRNLVGRIPARARPTALALLLATIAWPIVAVTMTAVDPVHYVSGAELPASALARWSAAASAVFLSALVAGSIGGLLVQRRAIVGGLFTFVLALMVAIASVLLLPLLLGQEVGVACESTIAPGLSSSGCNPTITTEHPEYAVQALSFFWLAPFAEPVPSLVLAVGVSIWTAAVAGLPWRRRQIG